MNTYLYDEFLNTQTGDAYRLFPFGRVVKNGRVREITPEYARQFKLPHFKPAIKLGSHEDATPAGGHIVALEVRDDGLYALPEWNDNGNKALHDGAYRYQSPEVIWDDGGLEDPQSGDFIKGPLIVGDALLHTPHLGEAAAMYSVEPIENKEQTMEGTVNVPAGLWDKFTAFLDARLNPPQPEKIEVIPDDYEATRQERDEYKTKLEAIEQAKARAARIEKFESELKDTKADPTMAELLADVPQDTADAIMKQFRALSEQINEPALTGEQGSEGTGVEDPKAAFNALVVKKSAEGRISYNAAFELVKGENPDLFAQAFANKK